LSSFTLQSLQPNKSDDFLNVLVNAKDYGFDEENCGNLQKIKRLEKKKVAQK
jgi:hypothetical protein